jgi:hypothetical protein
MKEIDGKIRFLNKRKYCLNCSPFGSKNRKKLEVEDGGRNQQFIGCNTIKLCLVCGKDKKIPKGEVCSSCRQKIRRIRAKYAGILLLGKKCNRCGYELSSLKDIEIFDFHHQDPSEKDFDIGSALNKRWEETKEELKKCILLCSNCHRLEHSIRENDIFEIAKKYKGKILYIEGINDLEWGFKSPPVKKENLMISEKTLNRLLWEMPIVEIAKMFGVTDSAIIKHCKKYNLKRPGRGYWAKVRANEGK